MALQQGEHSEMRCVPVRVSSLLALLPQTDSHHAPCDILHAFLVRQILLCFRKEAPDLCGQRVLLGHILWARAHAGEAVIEAVQRLHLGQSTLRNIDSVGKVEAKLLDGVTRDSLVSDAGVTLVVNYGRGGARGLGAADDAAL